MQRSAIFHLGDGYRRKKLSMLNYNILIFVGGCVNVQELKVALKMFEHTAVFDMPTIYIY